MAPYWVERRVGALSRHVGLELTEGTRQMANEKNNEKGKAVELLLEDASAEEEELCPCCNDMSWLRLVGVYKNGVCYVIYCGSCGKPSETKWNPTS